jgi:hypothetical protein
LLPADGPRHLRRSHLSKCRVPSQVVLSSGGLRCSASLRIRRSASKSSKTRTSMACQSLQIRRSDRALEVVMSIGGLRSRPPSPSITKASAYDSFSLSSMAMCIDGSLFDCQLTSASIKRGCVLRCLVLPSLHEEHGWHSRDPSDFQETGPTRGNWGTPGRHASVQCLSLNVAWAFQPMFKGARLGKGVPLSSRDTPRECSTDPAED